MSAPLTVADVLDRAADILEAEGAWLGGPGIGEDELATDADGEPIAPTSPRACHFCLYGALEAAAEGDRIEFDAHGVLCEFTGTPFLAERNHREGRTQAEVVSALRSSAEAARAGGAA